MSKVGVAEPPLVKMFSSRSAPASSAFTLDERAAWCALAAFSNADVERSYSLRGHCRDSEVVPPETEFELREVETTLLHCTR